jgi:FKBP-type peptidyl-prolyl cis-trans isomerase
VVACGSDKVTTPTGPSSLVIEDIVIGTGAAVLRGDTISVNYVGTFLDGRQFDSSINHGGVSTFRIGVGQVIAGWDQGIPGMRVGGKRRLTVPSTLAYGSTGNAAVPPNTPLRFDIDLLSIGAR